MLTKNKSNRNVIFKYLLFIPMLMVLIYSCAEAQIVPPSENMQKDEKSTPVIAYELTDTVVTFDTKTLKESVSIVKSDVYKVVERMPLFKGCGVELQREELYACAQKKLLQFIYSNVVYPKTAKVNKAEGTVVAQFVIYSDGEIGEVKILRKVGHGCDKEVERVIKSMPKWLPGVQGGKEVNVQYVLPVKFKLS